MAAMVPAIAPAYTDLLENYTIRKYMRGPDESIAAKSEHVVLERSITGFFVFAYLRTNNPDVAVVVDLYGDGTLDIVLSPRRLYEDGLLAPSGSSAWVARYDETNNVYVALFTPSPWLPWNGFARIKVVNPTLAEAKYTFISWILEKKGEHV